MDERISSWARLGKEPCGVHGVHHEFDQLEQDSSRECIHCCHIFANADIILDSDIDLSRLNQHLCSSPKQETCAMDDSFLEDLDNNRTRRLKRQFECLNNLQPKFGKYGVCHFPSVSKFKPNLKGPSYILFPKSDEKAQGAMNEVTPAVMHHVSKEVDEVLVCVKFEHGVDRGSTALTKTMLCLPARATINDVLGAVATKLVTSCEQIHAEFSPRDTAGAFLGLDDPVKDLIILRSRTLSL
jgi:hypothetical protein